MSTICDDLRAAILQAAMQGKLTKQLPEDGDAIELLKKIDNFRELNGNKCKPSLTVDEGELTFNVPQNWTATRLSSAFDCIMGSSPVGESVSKNAENGVEFHQGKIHFGDKYIQTSGDYTSSPSRIADANTVLLCVRAPIGKVNITDRQLCIGRGLACIKPLCGVTVDYLYYLLLSLEETFVKQGTGSTFKAIGKDVILNQAFLLPPLAEQKRIVEKIDELMARVADLEQSADALTSLKKAFPDDIKASLLQAAMQGKLTKQLPEDGSAEDLLEGIKAKKEKLFSEGKIKKQKPLAPITDDEIPFNIPENWKWERFGNLGSYRKGPFGSALTKSIFIKDSANAIKVYEQKNAIKKDASLGDYFISHEYYEDKMKNFRVLPGDIIVSCAGTIGETYILPEGIREGIINQALMRMRMFNGVYIPYFLIYFDYIIKASAISNSKGSAIKNIPPFEVLYMYPVAIPPLAEQKRIVERLNTLMQNIDVVGDLIASE